MFGILFRFRNFICYALCLLTIVMYDSYWRDAMERQAHEIGKEQKMSKEISDKIDKYKAEVDKQKADIDWRFEKLDRIISDLQSEIRKVNDDMRSVQSGNGGKKNKATKRR